MATLTIRSLEEETKRRLQVRAAAHGRSMEAEAREILRGALAAPSRPNLDLASAIRARVAPLGGFELEIPPREAPREPPELA